MFSTKSKIRISPPAYPNKTWIRKGFEISVIKDSQRDLNDFLYKYVKQRESEVTQDKFKQFI